MNRPSTCHWRREGECEYTQRHSHRHTHTHRPRDRQMDTHTQTHRNRHIHKHRHTSTHTLKWQISEMHIVGIVILMHFKVYDFCFNVLLGTKSSYKSLINLCNRHRSTYLIRETKLYLVIRFQIFKYWNKHWFSRGFVFKFNFKTKKTKATSWRHQK